MNTKNHTETDATLRYINENKYIFSLSKEILSLYGGSGRELECMSITNILLNKISNFFHFFIGYGKTYIRYHHEIARLSSLRGGAKNKAMVIGNGPSQGYITPEILSKFKSNGHSIYAVNFWHKNKALESIAPDYLVISDPATLADPSKINVGSDRKKDNNDLIDYLKKNKDIKILCPFEKVIYIKGIFGVDRIYGFCDLEVRWVSKNIDPRYPRGYLSMTLLKALGLASFIGHKKMYVIGMDNTYPRNIYCDENNHVINHEVHAGQEDSIIDFNPLLPSMAVALQEYLYIFSDTQKCFGGLPVLNLDPYSLTDAFPKISSISNINSMLTSI